MKLPLPNAPVLLIAFVLLCGIQRYPARGSTLRPPLPEIPVLPLPTQPRFPAFEWSAESRQLYRELIKLKLPGALHVLQQQAEAQPGNGMLLYLQNYADVIGLLISEDAKLYQTLPERESHRLDQLAELSSDSPYYLFTQAEVKLQCALVKFKFGEEIRAGWGIRQAYKLLVENKKRGSTINVMLCFQDYSCK